jgi:hypothetical protein
VPPKLFAREARLACSRQRIKAFSRALSPQSVHAQPRHLPLQARPWRDRSPTLIVAAFGSAFTAAPPHPLPPPQNPSAPSYAIGPKKLFTGETVFYLNGAVPGSTAIAESFIRIRGEDMAPGKWRLKVWRGWRRGRGGGAGCRGPAAAAGPARIPAAAADPAAPPCRWRDPRAGN